MGEIIEEKPMFMRSAEKADAQIIKRIAIASRLDSWTIEDYQLETENENGIFLILTDGKMIYGFILARLIMNQASFPQISSDSSIQSNNPVDQREAEIYNLAVIEEFRGKGLASKLIDGFIEKAAERGIAKTFLEVRKSNLTARKFYEKNGFKDIGERKNFYTNPNEDAILMRLSIVAEKFP